MDGLCLLHRSLCLRMADISRRGGPTARATTPATRTRFALRFWQQLTRNLLKEKSSSSSSLSPRGIDAGA